MAKQEQETQVTSWESASRELPPLLKRLKNADRHPRLEHPPIPKSPGLYLFSDKGRHMYVGQSRNLRERLRAHTIPSAGQEQASFAFLLAVEKAEELGHAVEGTRKEKAAHKIIGPLFLEQKERVRNMDVQFVVEADPIIRTLFEVYATLRLHTERYNSFETH